MIKGNTLSELLEGNEDQSHHSASLPFLRLQPFHEDALLFFDSHSYSSYILNDLHCSNMYCKSFRAYVN